jgi:hypothetical protein
MVFQREISPKKGRGTRAPSTGQVVEEKEYKKRCNSGQGKKRKEKPGSLKAVKE